MIADAFVVIGRIRLASLSVLADKLATDGLGNSAFPAAGSTVCRSAS
jgi:hypothetical protein